MKVMYKLVKIYLILIISMSILYFPLEQISNNNSNLENRSFIEVLEVPKVSVAEEWSITWGGNSYETGYGGAIDILGNIYVSGYTYGFGAGGGDLVLVKYDNTGLQIWNRTWGGALREDNAIVASDGLGSIYLAGNTFSFGAGLEDIVLVKYNSDGIQQWNTTWGGIGQELCYGIAVDSFGNIIITGTTDSFGAGNGDLFLIKYDDSGIRQWNLTWGGSAYDAGLCMAVDSSDNIYLGGVTNSFGAGVEDMLLVKYDTFGVQQWNYTWGGGSIDVGNDIALDISGNIYLTGHSYSFGVGLFDMVLVKYDENGVQQWNRTWGGSNVETGMGIEGDLSGNVYITGWTQSFGAGFRDIILVKYNNLGAQIWNRTWGGVNSDIGEEILLDASGDMYIIGTTRSLGEENGDIVLIKFENVPPEIKINYPYQYQFFGSLAPYFNISILEAELDTMWYTLDDGITNITFSGFTGTINQSQWNKIGDGIVTIIFYANDTTDRLGFAEVNIYKDISAPISSISFIPYRGTNIVNRLTIFTITANDGAGVGISVIEYKINESAWIDYLGPFNLSSYTYGYYLISYHAIDQVDNVELVNTLLVELVEITSITINTPQSSSLWETNSSHNIYWNSTGTISNVKIDLYMEGVFEMEIITSTPNDGSYAWDIPSGLEDSIQYQIKISDVSNPSTYDFSEYFEIYTLIIDSLTITNPDSLTTWETEKFQEINWTSTGTITNVKIELYMGGVFEMEIITSTTNDGFYTWDIPSGLEDSTQYQIKISDVSNPATYDFSDYFEIKKPSEGPPGIPGYNLFLVLSALCVISIIIVEKRLKNLI